MKALLFILLFLPVIVLPQPNPNPCPYDNTLEDTTWVNGAVVGDNTSGIAWSGWGHTLVGMESNKSYLITLCISQTNTSFDNQITIYPHGGGQAVAWNDDSNCSSDTKYPEIIFTPPNNGDYDILFDEYWNNYCQHFNDGIHDYFSYYMEVLSSTTNINDAKNDKKKLISVLNVLGQEAKTTNQPLFYLYDNGSVEKRMIFK